MDTQTNQQATSPSSLSKPELQANDFVWPVASMLDVIPVGANPFNYDDWLMGTDLVRGWVAMHPGYDNKSDPSPLDHMVLVNTRTGQRIRLDLRPIYEYRGLPCVDNHFSVSGKDVINGGGGILEWCSSLDDAKERFSIMRRYDYQFKDLKIYNEKEGHVVEYDPQSEPADDESFSIEA